MTSGMPELGSKISLISKADIRYEGRLFTVDPQECTIALASVRSFGTEDRETQYPVPAQNQVYDYILFRGSDIKDIRVVNNVTQPLNDPAIMQLSVPPSLGGQQFQSHPVLGHLGGPQMGQFPGAYGGMGNAMGLAPGMNIPRDTRSIGGNKPSELLIGTEPSVVPTPIVEPPRVTNEHATVLDLIGGGSRSTTPASLSSRKSPTAEQGTQAGGKRDDKKVVKPIQPPGQRSNQQFRRNSRERRDSRGDGQMNRQSNNRNQNHPAHHSGGSSYHHQGGGGYYNNHSNQGGNQQRGAWVNRGPMRPRGRPRGGGFKGNQGQPTQGNKVKNTLKFENDYDFEQANTEFEELRSQLAKVKIDEGSSASVKSEVNGSAVSTDPDKKDDSGNETGAGETEQEEDHEIFYDKSKSFFDKISCEAVERAKGKSQRTDWRTERKLNSETFGVSATRRGNYRGRGGFRGMGYRGGGYRGGYRQSQRRDQPQGNRLDQVAANKQLPNLQNTNTNATAAVAADVTVQKSITSDSASASALQNTVSSSSTKQVTAPEPAMAVI